MAVLADCHIHPNGGPAFPNVLLDALAAEDVDLIVTLGDMGEAAGLDQLADIAPVIGVRGQDDSDDPRTDQKYLRLTTGRYDLGCVFDAKAAGLATTVHPFDQASDFGEVSRRLFGVYVDVLLHASTHKAEEGSLGWRGSALNPGSAVLRAEGCEASWLLLNVSEEGCFGRIVPVT
ncbi:MAG TPA: metallophosphoesterase family protein [Phenylobacterium sp.]